MRRVVGRIEIDRDEPHAVAEALAMEQEHGVDQRRAESVEIGAAHGVFEPRQRWLRAQGRARERIALERQLLDGIADQPRRIVAVGVAARHAKHALPHQIA